MLEGKNQLAVRSFVVYFGILCFAVAIIARILYIQISIGEEYRAIDQDRNIRIRNIEAARGNIYSDDGSLLATSVPVFDLFWDATVCSDEVFEKDVDSLAISLAQFFKDKSTSEYKNQLITARKKGNRYMLIKRSNVRNEKKQVSYSDLKKIKEFPIFRLGRNRGGFITEQKNVRKMPYRLLAYRTIGYEQKVWRNDGKDTGIFVGLEGAYADYLKGIDGRRVEQKLRGGLWMPVTEEDQIEPQNGNDIYTTINISIQDVAEHALLRQLDSTEADHGCAILMEVETGYIKAIANLKRREDGSYGEDMNFAIWESSEPGSTFKLASLIALLEDGKVDTNEIVPTGKKRFGKYEMKDSYEPGYGDVSLARAFEVSSNVGIATLVTKVFGSDPQRFVDLLKKMGLGERLGVEIQGEGKPVLKDFKDKSWSITTLPWMSIGYEVQNTPLQLLAFYNAIANNGKMMKPQFVKEIRHIGEIIQKNEPIVMNARICKPSTAHKARACMEGVVEHGTAKRLSNEVYKIAGKTGTAQIARSGGGYGNKKDQTRRVEYKASFIGYFPSDKPKYSCIVVINNPRRKGFYGSEIAAPVFREIANKVYTTEIDIPKYQADSVRIKNIPLVNTGNQNDLSLIYTYMRYKTLKNNKKAEWVSANTTSGNFVRLIPQKFKKGMVPNLKGMGVKDAVYLLEKCGYKAQIKGKGIVSSQSVNPGTELKKGQTVILTLQSHNASNTQTYIQTDSTYISAIQDSIDYILKKTSGNAINKNE
ncbi:MAG: penicillin-binding protein [Bacteroidales bacterium]|nr:penicillin-binding protein [Bacteroidales bacterium]